jgi:hypothetical protein
MIKIKTSKTADTRTCDVSKVTKKQLIESSEQHITDVVKGFSFFIELMRERAELHDIDKLIDIDSFYADFITNFESTKWWDNHRKIARHHLLTEDGIPEDINLVDVFDMIIDCVMAGMGRSGDVYPLEIDPKVLMAAFNNTVDLLKSQVIVVE